jgi:hypothetical protein
LIINGVYGILPSATPLWWLISHKPLEDCLRQRFEQKEI